MIMATKGVSPSFSHVRLSKDGDVGEGDGSLDVGGVVEDEGDELGDGDAFCCEGLGEESEVCEDVEVLSPWLVLERLRELGLDIISNYLICTRLRAVNYGGVVTFVA